MRLEHYNISGPMTFLEKVRDFYVNVVGLEDGSRPESRVRGFWLYTGSTPVVHLAESETHAGPIGPSHLDHIAFSCDNFEQLRRRLDRADIPYEVNRIQSAGLTQIFLRDPAGILLELNVYGHKPKPDTYTDRSSSGSPDSENRNRDR